MFDYYQSIGCLLYLYGYVINLHIVNFQIKIGFLYGRCFVIIYSLIFKYMFQFWAEGCLFFLPMMCWSLSFCMFAQFLGDILSDIPYSFCYVWIHHSVLLTS
jgi:hypothetical protein